MNEILQTISMWIHGSTWLAPVFAILAGILTSLTPCSLSTLPLIIGYVSNGVKDTKQSFRISIVFSIGMAVTFTILGIVSALLGKMMKGVGSVWYIGIGIFMIIMALQTWELITFIKPTYLNEKNKKKGYIGAFLTGILAGVFSSPCATPVLAVLLAIVGAKGSLLWGAMLLLLYAVGNSFLVLLVGTSVGFTRKLISNPQYGKFSNGLKWVLGIMMLLLGLYFIYLGF